MLDQWFEEINEISKDVHDHKTRDVQFQKSLEASHQRVDLPALLESLDFDRLAAGVEFPAKGAKSLSGDESADQRACRQSPSSAGRSSR